jgi:hypothetical protein
LAVSDRAVRSHEQAHVAVGGQYAGAPRYSLKRGPDGINYAVGGEVPIDVSPVSGNPEATIRKMEQVRRAAQAPADPSSQDLAVSARAAQTILQARAELAQQQRGEAAQYRELRTQRQDSADYAEVGVIEDEAIQTYLELVKIGERIKGADDPLLILNEIV